MARYLLMRLTRWTTGLALVLFITYALMFYGAGDPVRRMFVETASGGVFQDEAAMRILRARYGFDKPFPEQFANYVKNVLQGNLGWSIRENRGVNRMVQVRLPISMQLGLVATAVAALVGIPLGVIAALKHNRWQDNLIVGTSVFVNAVPIFVTGPLFLIFFVLVLKVMDVPFGWQGLFNKQVILPLAVMAMGPLPTIVRQTRAGILEVMGEDYIRTARAKGLPEMLVITRHMVRPVMIPVVTSIGMIAIGLVNGALFVETIYNIPGFGQLTYQGLMTVDYSIILAVVLVGTLIVMVSNLVVDLIYPFLDPRITHQG